MLLEFGLQLVVLLLTVLATSCDARSRSELSEDDLHDANVGCEPTNCPNLCPREVDGYHYYYSTDGCLRCKCGRPKGQVCRSGAVNIGGQCLRFSTESVQSWHDAKRACSSQNGQLASFKDPKAVLAYTEKNYGVEFWAGGSDIENEGTWTWISGEPIVGLPWSGPACSYEHQPDNKGGYQDCLVVNWVCGGYDDQYCYRNPHRYICDEAVLIGGQYLTFSKEKVPSWEHAKEKCKAMNARLAVLANPGEFHEYAYKNFHGTWFYLGASDIASEGTWKWIDGQQLQGSFPWGPRQPDNGGDGQDCLTWGYGDNFDDEFCVYDQHYVCEHQ